MNTFKRKALSAAVLAGLGVAGTAEAVYHDVNGVGQVLIYPYYTVNSANGGAFNTYLSVVNTTPKAKVVKVRFREGKTSVEVLDFNLYLSPNDVWTGAVVPADGASATSPGRLVSADVSCTNPPIPATGVDFRNTLYLTGGDSLPGTGLERTREGYAEIIEMGTLTGVAAANVTHNASGTPANCTAVQGQTVTLLTVEAPQGGLSGTGTLINVANGSDAGYVPDALAEFRTAQFYTDITSDTPNLGSADAVSVVVNTGTLTATGTPAGATLYRSDWVLTSGVNAGARAVAAVYMHTAVMNEYILDSTTQSLTDWVVTQPVKRFFVSSTTAAQPYTAVLSASGACEVVGLSFFNREERGAAAAGVDFSPLPAAGPANSICWESTVISFRNGAAFLPPSTASTVLGSANVTNVNVTSTFQNGWAILSFTGANAIAPNGMGSFTTSDRATTSGVAIAVQAAGAQTFFGLPVTGFMVRTFKNGNLACGTATCQGNYGSAFEHSYRTSIAP
jgi:hypothetical protein